MGQLRIVGAHGVLHGVFGDAARGAFHHAGQGAGPGHFGACLQVASVLDGHGEVFVEQADGLKRKEVADGGGAVGNEAFGGVEEGVEALVGGELRRDGHHQFGVDDGDGGIGERTAEAYLLVHLFVGYHGPGVGFGAGACGGGDGYDGQRAFHRTALAASGGDVVPIVALVAGHDGDGFGRVNRAASAQADHHVAAFGAA